MTDNQGDNSVRKLRYVRQLNALIKAKPCELDLLPPAAMEMLRGKVKLLNTKNKQAYRLPFEEKASSRFGEFVAALAQANGQPVLIWTELSNDFGPARVQSLLDFDFGFAFDVLPEGIVALVTESGTDKLLLDWEAESDEERAITVEIVGENWRNVPYPTS